MDGYYAQVRLGIGKAILSYKRRADLRTKAFFPSLLAKRRAERRRRRRLICAARGFYTLEREDAESVRHQLDKVLKIPQKIRKYPWQELESLSSSEAVVPSGHASRDTKIKARKLSPENWRCQNAGTSEGHHAGDNTLTAAKLRAMIEREFRVGKKRKNAMSKEGRTSDQRSALHGSIEYEFAIGKKYRKTSYHNRLQLHPKDTHITSARLHSAIERRLESYNQGDISQLFGRSQDHQRITEDVQISVGKLDTTNEIHELAAEISSQILKERMQGFCNEKKQPSSLSSSTNPQHGKSSEHADVSEAGSDCSSESFLLVADDDEDIRMLYDLINGLDGISNEQPSDKHPNRLQQADQAIRSSVSLSGGKKECKTDVQSIGDRVSLRIGRRMSRKNTSETSSDHSGPSEGFLLIADDDGEIKTLYDLITGFDDIDGKQSNENSLNSVQQATPATQSSKLFSYVKKDRRKPAKPIAECTPMRNSRWASGKMTPKQKRGREKRRNSREETDVERHKFHRKKWHCSAPEKKKRTQYTTGRRYKRTQEQPNDAHLICAANPFLHTCVPRNGVQPSPAGKHLDKMCSQLEKCREMRSCDEERPQNMMPVKSKPGFLVKREKAEPEQDTTEDVIIILSDSDDETPVRKQLNYRIERQKVKTEVPEIIEISDSEDENQPNEPSSAELQPKCFQGLLQNTVSLSHEMTTDCDVMPVTSTQDPLLNTANPDDENDFCLPSSAAVAQTAQDIAKTHHRRKQRSPKRAGSQPILPFHRTLADSYKRLKTLGDSSAKDRNQSASGKESLPTQTPQTFCTLEGVKNDAQLCSSTEQAGKYDFHENECEIIVEGALDYYGHGDWAAEPKCHHE